MLHVKDEYDYRIRSDARDQFIDIIRKLFHNTASRPLALYGVKPKNLGEFTTGKKDLKKGLSRIPLELARIKDEDEIGGNSDMQFNIGEENEDFNN